MAGYQTSILSEHWANGSHARHCIFSKVQKFGFWIDTCLKNFQTIPRTKHMSLMYVCTNVRLSWLHCNTQMSALISALRLSKCHLVSLIFRSFTKKSNLRWKRYFTSKTLRITMHFFIAAVLSNASFLNPCFYFGSSHAPWSIIKLFCAQRGGCKVITMVVMVLLKSPLIIQ